MTNLDDLVKEAGQLVYGIHGDVTVKMSDGTLPQVVTVYRGHSDTILLSDSDLQSDEKELLARLIVHFTNFKTAIDPAIP